MKMQESNCGFFDWIDPEMCQRSREIIPGLIRGRNVLEEQLRGQVEEARRLKKYLKISWVFFVLVVLFFKC
ncbi:hypothetical protein Hanom_Chr12g01149161 [Helianthus anomalus]